MAKRRTRKEKLQAKHQYGPTYTLSTESGVSGLNHNEVVVAQTGLNQTISLSTDTPLIKRDILKSVIISGLILLVEFGIYWYWYK